MEDVICGRMEAVSGVLEQAVEIGELTETIAGAVELANGGLKSATQWAAARQSSQAVEKVVTDARVACSLVQIGVSTGRRADLAYSLLGSTGVYSAFMAEMDSGRERSYREPFARAGLRGRTPDLGDRAPWRELGARVACMLEGEAPQVSVADDVLELAVSVTSMQSRWASTVRGANLGSGGVLRFGVGSSEVVRPEKVVLVGVWETPGGLPVVMAATDNEVYLMTGGGKWSLLSIDEASHAGILRQISGINPGGVDLNGNVMGSVEGVDGVARTVAKTFFFKRKANGAGGKISNAIQSLASGRYGTVVKSWEAALEACELRLSVTTSEVGAMMAGELILDDDGNVNVPQRRLPSSLAISATTGLYGSLSWQCATLEPASGGFSSAFKLSAFGTATRRVTREEMCQEMGVSLMSPGSRGRKVLPLEVMGVGKPMYALPSLGVIMAEPGTYVGVGGGPSLQPLSDVCYEGGCLAVAAAVDALTGSHLTSYVLDRLVSEHSLGPGSTDEEFRRRLPSTGLSLSVLYEKTTISEATTLAVLHIWGVDWVGETSEYGCLVAFLERSTPGRRTNSLSVQVDCLTNMKGMKFLLETWRDGTGEYENFKPRKFLLKGEACAYLEKKLENTYHLTACEPLSGWDEKREAGYVGFKQ